ncbi:MAG: hypothetical protein AAF560_25935 [Acidobacteriota bacterium]
MQGAELLLHRLERLRQLRRDRQRDAARADRLRRITEWQVERLAVTHSDLLDSPRYRPAVQFFLTDLYGPMDFSQRDNELARISPMLARVLSENALRTMGRALEMNILTEEVDAAMERSLSELGFPETLDEEIYASAFRRCDDADKRRRQIALIREVGEDLDQIVARPFIEQALKMARRPATFSGLGDLHQLLERGFYAFHGMRGADEFLEAIVSRELEILDRIYDRHPRPFQLDEG